MLHWPRSIVSARTALVLMALFLGSSRAPLRAQMCPTVTLSITRTTPANNLNAADQDAGLTGSVAVMFTEQGTIDYTVWDYQYLLNIYGADGVLVWQAVGTTGTLQSGESYIDWTTTGMRRPYDPQNPLTGAIQPAVGPFQVEVELQTRPKTPPGGPWTCSFFSPRVRRTLSSPLTAQTDPDDKLNYGLRAE